MSSPLADLFVASGGSLGIEQNAMIQEILIEPLLDSSCPLGFICDPNQQQMANCTRIRQLPVLFGMGDIHAGSYCPAGSNNYMNCPIGSYCELPDRIEPCPAGMFCPHKTAVPTITCSRCKQGATKLARQLFGFLIIAFLITFCIAYVIVHLLRRYRADLYKHLLELSRRQFDNVRILKLRAERQELLEQIRPKLFAINARLKLMHEANQHGPPVHGHESFIHTGPASSGHSSNSSRPFVSPIFAADGKTIRFNAAQLFGLLDQNNNGFLTYTDLQAILELNPLQLKEFVERMNEFDLTGTTVHNDTVVSQACFLKHFLSVLQETHNFGPTPKEVEERWDDIAQGRDKVRFEEFYVSSLSKFLSDPQINNLIRRFRTIQDEVVPDRSIFRYNNRSTTRVTENPSSIFGVSRIEFPRDRSKWITRQVFLDHYARLLVEVTTTKLDDMMTLLPNQVTETTPGIDIAFEDLSLSVRVGETSVNVVNHVSGRIAGSKMTALMGGSGAGKTSLLNALCGRAFYGETTGKIFVNGHEASIEDHRSSMGFVPQDDIVHGALTVRENLVFSGLFSLPSTTSRSEIEDLADATMANLGLSRVADSLVGDVNRRGISGGEKKRVNIGVELMKKPSILFLDEPTSGLDSSSALLVMKSLKTLVDTYGVTVLSVIHQPRKFIFDLFDSLVLLGVGGNMVYHGSVVGAEQYFRELPEPYNVPVGESVADWLIDVSSGRLEPEQPEDDGFMDDDDDFADTLGSLIFDIDAVGRAGPSSNKVDTAFEEANLRRQILYDAWKERGVIERFKIQFRAPEPYDLPVPIEKPSFCVQLIVQLRRNFLLAWRNRSAKLVDTAIILVAVCLICLFEGVVEVTRERDPNIMFGPLTSGNPMVLVQNFMNLFGFATRGVPDLTRFGLQLGIIVSVLLGLMASRAITQYRLEFFREAGSGYNINAYFLAVNISSLLEHSIQMILAAMAAFWIRDSIAIWFSYYVNFITLMWTCVGWALLIPLLVPPENVVMVVGFFVAFFGLLFSGALPPVEYDALYDGNPAVALFSGFVSVTRYFVEGLTVHELRCLPPQSGFTVDPLAYNFPLEFSASAVTNLGQNDRGVVRQTCSGWYWSVLPAFAVGLIVRYVAAGVIHVSYRSKQAKRPLFNELFRRPLGKNSTFLRFVAYMIGFVVLFVLTSWFILGTRGDTGIASFDAQMEDPAFANDYLDNYAYLFP